MRPETAEERQDWADLAERYRIIYRQSLQQRLATQGADVQHWWEVGRRIGPAPPVAASAGPNHTPVWPPTARGDQTRQQHLTLADQDTSVDDP
jgi:hypothetical protein